MYKPTKRYNDMIDRLKKIGFKFDSRTEMDTLKINERLHYYESFAKVFSNDISIWFYKDILNRLGGHIENNVCIFIFGAKGTIKSSIAISLAKMFCPDFNVETDIVFTNEDLKKVMRTSKKGQWFIRDETLKDYGTGSKQLETDIQMFVETLRKRQNCLIFLSPTEHTINAVDYVLHTFSGNFNNEFKQASFGIIDVSGTKRYLGGGRIFLDWNTPEWKKYNDRKDKFMENVVQSDTQSYDLTEIAKQIIDAEGFDKCKSKKEIELFVKEQIPHCVTQVQKDIATKISMLLREGQEQ